MATKEGDIVATSQKRPASEDTEEEPAGKSKSDESAAKKPKPASSFSELASIQAAKEAGNNGEPVKFVTKLAPSRSGLPLGFSKKTGESADSDHADSPSVPQAQLRFSSSPSDSQSSPRPSGSFSLAPPTLAAPGAKAETIPPATFADFGSTGLMKGSHLIKDMGFGPRPELSKAPKPSVPSQNPFLICLQKKTEPAPFSSAASSEAKESDGPPRFVFGQNLTDRAKVPPASSAAATSSANGSSTTLPAAESAIAGGSTTTNSAQELPIVDVVTGEEGERNVIQITCRFFNFNRDSRQWVERGRGILRLNDKEATDGPPSSRLVIRSAGSLRVIVNCVLWAGQSCEKVNLKSARLTVMSGSEIEIVLIKASPVEITDLVTHINKRLHALKQEKKIVKPEPPKFTSGTSASDKKSTEASEEEDKETAKEKKEERLVETKETEEATPVEGNCAVGKEASEV